MSITSPQWKENETRELANENWLRAVAHEALYAASALSFEVACAPPDLTLMLIAWYGELCLLSA